MSKPRIAFIGVGGMGQCAHLRNYAALKDLCEVIALAEARPELGKKVAQRYDIPHVYTSHTDLLKHEKPDGLVASQPFTRHGTLLPDLLATGIPLFTEKPLAGSIEMGEKILKSLAAAKAANPKTFYMVGYHKRSDPATRFAKAEIDRLQKTKELGKLKYLRLLMPAGDWIAAGFNDLLGTPEAYPSLASDAPAPDMDQPTNDAYISFVNYYIHQVNLLRFLLGESYRVSYADPAGVLLVAHSASGIPCTIEMSPYCTTIDWQESATICFEKGWLKLELPAPLAHNRPGQVTLYTDPGNGVTPTLTEPTLPWVHAMRQQAMNFIAAIKGEAPPPCTAEEAIEDLKVARDYIRLWKGK